MIELQRLIAEASVLAGNKHPCNILGHKWVFYGGRNCGCEGIDSEGYHWQGSCSIPVMKCEGCGDFDYGNNQEASDIIETCGASDEI